VIVKAAQYKAVRSQPQTILVLKLKYRTTLYFSNHCSSVYITKS